MEKVVRTFRHGGNSIAQEIKGTTAISSGFLIEIRRFTRRYNLSAAGELKEWFDEGVESVLPRLISLVFKK
ncbi:hypothetical protein HPE56_07370 [Maribacter sp. ANRC-HE7]|uniref:Uncharacterized protein n=1 Tax=Maribacter aquimaris TaxID=2737171 RepID=A0ABR7UYN9_9FLAO|nr:hypothetical protein [Maribacter aquimaris]MBD0777608.1 hypothetical protein [Maribacter aquimaris]